MKKDKRIVVEFVSEKPCESLKRILRFRTLIGADKKEIQKRVTDTSTQKQLSLTETVELLGASQMVDFESVSKIGKKHIVFVPGLKFNIEDEKLFIKDEEGDVKAFFEIEDIKGVYYR